MVYDTYFFSEEALTRGNSPITRRRFDFRDATVTRQVKYTHYPPQVAIDYGDGSGSQITPLPGKRLRKGTKLLVLVDLDSGTNFGAVDANRRVVADHTPNASILPHDVVRLKTFLHNGANVRAKQPNEVAK